MQDNRWNCCSGAFVGGDTIPALFCGRTGLGCCDVSSMLITFDQAGSASCVALYVCSLIRSTMVPATPTRRNRKRRAANVKVTKRAAPQNNNANATGGNNAGGAGGQEDGSGQDKELMGVVSLVQLERHYGFIEVCKNTNHYREACTTLADTTK